jgi:hypothetical protein
MTPPCGQGKMNMIFYIPFQNLHTFLAANIPDHFPRSIGYVPRKDWLAILVMVDLTTALFARFHVNGVREDIASFFY